MTLRPNDVHRTVLLAAHDGTQPTLDAAIAAHDRTGIMICADKQTCRDASGQAAILTAVVTARRAFGTVTVHAEDPAVHPHRRDLQRPGARRCRGQPGSLAPAGSGPRRGRRGLARAAPRTGHACPTWKAPRGRAGLMARMDRESQRPPAFPVRPRAPLASWPRSLPPRWASARPSEPSGPPRAATRATGTSP